MNLKLQHYLQTKSDPGRRTTDSHHTFNSKFDIISAAILVQEEMFSDIVCKANCTKLCTSWTHDCEFSNNVFHEGFHQVEIIGMISANARRVIEQKHNVGVNITMPVSCREREREKNNRIITIKMKKTTKPTGTCAVSKTNWKKSLKLQSGGVKLIIWNERLFKVLIEIENYIS